MCAARSISASRAREPSTSKAVTDTAGEVVLYGGKVATTYYFSTSGGKTASAVDVFGTNVPYLVSRPDPWDKASPYHRWGPVLLGARTLQSKLGVDARVIDVTATATPSGRLRSLVAQTTDGPETVPASLVRTALGLRSTWIAVGVLRLDKPVAHRRDVRLGIATRRSRSRPRHAAAGLVTRRDGLVGLDRGHVRQDRNRHCGRQAGAHDEVPARRGGRLVAGRARPGCAARPADQADRRRADHPAGDGATEARAARPSS